MRYRTKLQVVTWSGIALTGRFGRDLVAEEVGRNFHGGIVSMNDNPVARSIFFLRKIFRLGEWQRFARPSNAGPCGNFTWACLSGVGIGRHRASTC
jgi:hypothetical protein